MKLYYSESGNIEAPLIVFLHGGGVSGWMWDKQIEYFIEYHCLVPDLPGHGLSASKTFSIRNSAEEIIDLIETKAQGKQVILIGFSLGAQVAIQILSIKPNLIDYAIINSALTRPISLAKKLIRPTIRLTHRLTKNRLFSKLQAKQLYIGKDIFEKYYQETTNMDLNVLINVLEENMSFHIPEEFVKSESKILVTVGEYEKKIMRKSAFDIMTRKSSCRVIVLSKVGHGVSLSQPDLFNRMVDAWINVRELPNNLTH